MIFEQYIQNNYLRALAIFISIFIVLKIFIYLTEKIIFKTTKKTKTELDDKIIEKSSKPLTIIIFLIGLKIAIGEVSLSENFESILFKLIYSIIIIFVGYISYFVIDLFILAGWKKISIKTKSNIDEGLISLIHSILKVTWIIFVFLYLLDLWGVKIGPFLAGLGIGGIAIAFALQESLSNIFGGVSIILDKTVKVGDLVYLDVNTRGTILKIGLRSTKIKTFDNEMIIIPNTILAQSKIQNIVQPEPKSRVVVPFSVAYGSNIEKVKKIVFSEIKKIKNISNKPEPIVRFLEMADSSLNFKVYFYVESFEYRINAKDEANTKIYNILNKNKIEIPFPKLDVNIKK
jgi:MscS family membrane protein